MSNTAEVFAAAFAQHQAGRVAEATALYEQVLAQDPDHADSLHLLGVAAHQLGQSDRAVALIEAAIARNPAAAAFRNNLGGILGALGRNEPALEAFRAAVERQPDYAEAHENLANLCARLGRADEAERHYRFALAQAPERLGAALNLAVLLTDRFRLAEAIGVIEPALRLAPGQPDLLLQRGNILYRLGRLPDAEADFRFAAIGNPNLFLAASNLGLVLNDLGRPEEAEQACRAALAVQPNYAGALLNLAVALSSQGRFEEAETACRSALALQPDWPEALTTLGAVSRALGRPGEAIALNRRAVALRPDFVEAHNNLAMALLAAGDFTAGWREYEWRWRAKDSSSPRRDFPQPEWQGEAMQGGTLLIHAEQGLGDTVQFCRFLPLAAQRARIVLEVPAPLRRLMEGLPGVAQLVTAGEPLPVFDSHCALMSLPHRLGTGADVLGHTVPYLTPPAAETADWRQYCATLRGLKVGLAWAGASRPLLSSSVQVDRRRSIALSLLAPLATIPGVVLTSLQKGDAAQELYDSAPPWPIEDWTGELNDFADTAALIQALDLVIAVDTAVAHLAGALGKPVWLLNRFDSCWRWQVDRQDSPWYPSLRQFRQKRPGDWAEVVGRVRQALEAEAARVGRS